MRFRTIVGSVALAALACHDQSPAPLAPAQTARAAVIDPALSGALLMAATGDTLFVIVNYDPSKTTADALSQSLINGGAGVIQFAHLSMVAALATPAQVAAAGQLPGVQSVYLNRKLSWLLLHESVPTIRADAVHVAGITGKGVGIAILDSGIDGLYNPDLTYPTKTVANVKVVANVRDLFTFQGSINKTIKKGAAIFIENLPNSETSVGHGTHVAGIAAGLGTASNGYYTGVAPGAKLMASAPGTCSSSFGRSQASTTSSNTSGNTTSRSSTTRGARAGRSILKTRSTRPRRKSTITALPSYSPRGTTAPTRTR